MPVETLHATSLRLDGKYMFRTVLSSLFTAAVETLHATSLRMDEKIPSIVTIVHCAVETLHATSLRMDGKYTFRTVLSALFTAAVETLHATSLRMEEKNVCHRQHSCL